MNKTKIEWCDYTINPVKGLCPMACPYCYARRMYKRFKRNPEIRYDPIVFDSMPNPNSKIFVGSTMELFGDWVNPEWMMDILKYVAFYDHFTFIFLTKQPQNLIKWSPFPPNVWVGVSTIGNDCRSGLEDIFKDFEAKVKFISIEPLLDYSPMDFRWVDWIIVGRQTPESAKTLPRREWLHDILESADHENKPVFLKNNLKSMLPFRQHFRDDFHDKCYNLRQEYPTVNKNLTVQEATK